MTLTAAGLLHWKRSPRNRRAPIPLLPSRDRFSSASRSVRFRIEIGSVPARDRFGSGWDCSGGASRRPWAGTRSGAAPRQIPIPSHPSRVARTALLPRSGPSRPPSPRDPPRPHRDREHGEDHGNNLMRPARSRLPQAGTHRLSSRKPRENCHHAKRLGSARTELGAELDRSRRIDESVGVAGCPLRLGVEPALHRRGHERVMSLGESVQAAPPRLECQQESEQHHREGDESSRTGRAARYDARAPGDADDDTPLGPQDLKVVAFAPYAPRHRPCEGGGSVSEPRARKAPRQAAADCMMSPKAWERSCDAAATKKATSTAATRSAGTTSHHRVRRPRVQGRSGPSGTDGT